MTPSCSRQIALIPQNSFHFSSFAAHDRSINSPRVLAVTRPQFQKAFEERLRGKAELIETDVEEFGNLYSVSLAMKHLDAGSFLLLTSDHIFERSIDQRFRRQSKRARWNALAA